MSASSSRSTSTTVLVLLHACRPPRGSPPLPPFSRLPFAVAGAFPLKIRPIDAEAKDEEWGDGEGEVGGSAVAAAAAGDDSLKLRFRRLRRREISLSGRLMET
ncbi:hypothetical protein ACJRO7_030514 [Eucalyptus globulus]|uniref:Uncharacterized protein n=1 Tax=Eucalyptus globulus TaxID=34317 RepID=A0ABD3JJ67_EUCGL